jgi:hypothetical protein
LGRVRAQSYNFNRIADNLGRKHLTFDFVVYADAVFARIDALFGELSYAAKLRIFSVQISQPLRG